MFLLLVGVVRLYLPAMYEGYAIRAFGALNPQYGEQTEVGFRIENYRVGAKMLASYPLFGVGLANFGAHAEQFGRERAPAHLKLNAHNAVLEVLTNTGLIGGLAYIFVWLLTFYELIFAARRGPPQVRPLAFGMAVGFLLYVTHSMFHSGYAALLLAFIFAMSTVMSRLSREGKAPSETATA
jgi:O-antigen ligase